VRGFVLAVLVVGTLSVPCGAQMQPGSTGGSIGKTDKSVSGGETPAQPDLRSTGARVRTNAPKPVTAATIEGNWDWEATCKGEQWQGGMILHAASATGFTGEFSKGHDGSIVGTISGNRVSFVRNWRGLVKQTWTASVTNAGSTLRMQGPFTDPVRSECRFSARKG
jgi:hypothetical protein